jgi:hypothetical protein
MRFAYADPPYPGLAQKYYQTEEVDHVQLIAELYACYPDGWALSTSSDALQKVLAICPAGVRVASWVKGERRGVSWRPRSAWEPLIVWGGRPQRIGVEEYSSDVLVWGGRQHSHPGALVGMKPAAYAEWMFRQLGAARGDELVDLFPGSGAITRAWDLYTRPPGGRDTSVAKDLRNVSLEASRDTRRAAHRDGGSDVAAAPPDSCLAGAERRLNEKLGHG